MQEISVVSNTKPPGRVTTIQVKQNNYIKQHEEFIHRIKYMFYVEALLGINRLYTIPCPKLIKILSYMYTLFLVLVTVAILVRSEIDSNIFWYITNNSMLLEYAVLAVVALPTGNKMIESQLARVHQFCQMLNICDASFVADCMKTASVWLVLCASLNVLELYLIYNTFVKNVAQVIYVFIILFGHDFEVIVLILQIRNIYSTLLVIKAHADRMFCTEDYKIYKLNKIQLQSLNVELDIKTLHDAYTLMDKCARSFNRDMIIPVMTLFTASAFYTTFLLKFLVRYVQINAIEFTYEGTSNTVYALVHTIKIVYLVVAPCYYASNAEHEAAAIRRVLSNALDNMTLGVQDRRRIKAFVCLMRECDFSYALCGLVKLDMAFPLAYLSFCFTYLIIIVQFSKFID